MANRAPAEKGLEELPTVEQYKQHGLRNIRAMWSQLIDHCRAVEAPEPYPLNCWNGKPSF
jgi:hypothetical protein